ncbi:phosphonatase-like hydrolase [Fulvivirgaceae bacterium BMA10]|uniref:Phosphonatase-like hydrolase n=1 Tax=Splendidivirga corallicola TaxID=3051826 RepID=A0ABT8KVY6_9BACT|nr:phosphonatase-like hydrolase [Fulvivirgaceae bacterium BMA10]
MNIKLVVFDMAGTTVNDKDYVHKVLMEVLSNEGMTISREQANEVMGIPKPTAIRKLLMLNYKGNREINDDFVKELHDRFVNKMAEFYMSHSEISEKEGATETFKKLKSHGIKVAIDTGFDRKIADTIINRLGWEENKLIDCSVTSDEVVHGRPFPDMIFKAMSQTNVNNRDEVVKVGDTVSDLQQGNNAGCRYVIGVTTGAFKKEDLHKEKHTHLIEKLTELPRILQLEQ